MKQKKRHILIATSEFPPQPGGIGNHAYNLALYLYKAGNSVEVIADQRSDNGLEETVFDASLPFSVKRIKLYNWRFLMYLKRVQLTFKSFNKVSTVIATGKFSLWNVAFCSFFFKIKTMAIIHGTEVNFKSFILRKSINFSLQRFEIIVAVSNYTKRLILHGNKDVIVIPNGIATSDWIHSKEKLKLKGNPVLTTVGRVSSRKGQLNVIEHLPKLIKQFPELHYHCIGISTEADAFLKVAKSLKVEEFVTFHGTVDHNKLKQMLAATQVFIMLSAESVSGDVEGFGIAILEANAMGVPAIGATGCGIEDAIENYKSGILIDRTAFNLEAAILEILEHSEDYKKSALLWAQKHSWSKIINQYLTLIEH